ncbi:MAG: alpha/beta hydrolase [Luminiphilus sp.]|nr:alpha/beta hydrolase [Luminiphilus sp.]
MPSIGSTGHREVTFKVHGLTYAAIEWPGNGEVTVLALHGWLDNALSFARIAPCLAPCRVISIDLSGHGLSSWRSADAAYNLWDDLPQLVEIVDQLNLNKVVLMGHSRGAAIAALLAGVLAERAQALIMIDGLLANVNDQRNAAQQLKNFVRDQKKYAKRGDRYFKSEAAFIARRCTYGFDENSANLLAPRALELTALGLRLRSDPRLFGISANGFRREQRLDLYREIASPVLGVFAGANESSPSDYRQAMLSEAKAAIHTLQIEHFVGTHHLHMNDRLAPLLASRCTAFLSQCL